MSPLALCVRVERWPIAGSFTISRGAKTEAVVVVAELSDGTHRGRGECVPYARYGETVAGVAAAIEAMGPEISSGLDREQLQSAMAPGAADLLVQGSGKQANVRPVVQNGVIVVPLVIREIPTGSPSNCTGRVGTDSTVKRVPRA